MQKPKNGYGTINSKIKRKTHFRIFDDIHGLIAFSKAERRIIDSPLFQRLRKIKQLGLAYFVFPGAMHTRFSHSIGTLAVAQRVISSLEICGKDAENLRMAALLHDIGHFPLSHTIESVYRKESEKLDKRITEKIRLSSSSLAPISESNEQDDASVKLHEKMSAFIVKETDYPDGITRILINEKYEPIEIANIITGRCKNIMLSQLMHSDIDIDQMDYLIRDSKNAGITYGSCDVEYLISNMIPHKYKKKLNVIFFSIKALRALEHFFLARYFYFTQVLYHKTRSIIEKSACEIYKTALEKKLTVRGKPIYQYLDLYKLYKSSELLMFDDAYFEAVVGELKKQKCNRRTLLYLRVIQKRKIPRVISEKCIDSSLNDNCTILKKKGINIKESFNILPDYEQIKRRTNWIDKERDLIYEDREAVRLIIPSKYEYKPKRIFLCKFEDSILFNLVRRKFELNRIYETQKKKKY